MIIDSNSYYTTHYDDNGMMHREDGPAYYSHNNNFLEWIFHGKFIAQLTESSYYSLNGRKRYDITIINIDNVIISEVHYGYDSAYNKCQSHFLRFVKLRAFM